MIHVCPQCGTSIPERLIDGIASCSHCSAVFDNSLFNRLLAASWLLRKHTYHGIAHLISDTRLAEHEAILVYSFISTECYSHEEFLKALRAFGID